ncbi:hypothetical protein L2E82_23076 [Cichorium intybus]|uniref:Uncharacterized protein n=1 Tax=Cichorium intybus TaxID=13427 RepID=A0ACB9DZ67_CICIN|nr:hypothetical protein L2E82_23076 [Cichorium intybus]
MSLGGTAVSADLGGSSKYSNENFEGRRGERFHVTGHLHMADGNVRQGKSAKWIRRLWRTARATSAARAGRRVAAEGRTGKGSFGGLPLALNSQLRTVSSETTAKQTGLAESAGKEDPVELDSSPTFGAMPLFLDPRPASAGRSGQKTLLGGEFGWGGTSVKR